MTARRPNARNAYGEKNRNMSQKPVYEFLAQFPVLCNGIIVHADEITVVFVEPRVWENCADKLMTL